MTIQFTPSGGSAQSLAGADSGQTDQPAGLRMSGQSQVQVEALPRAAAPSVFDRQNRRVAGSFSVKKQHADFETAIAYVASHISATKGVGSLVFSWSGGSLTLSSAVIVAEGHAAGATSEWNYQFEGTQA